MQPSDGREKPNVIGQFYAQLLTAYGGATQRLPTPLSMLIFVVHFLLSYFRSQTQITLPSHVKVCLLHNSCVKIDPHLFE